MLPVRDGVGPSQVALPPGAWATMLDFLVQRFAAVPPQEWRRRMAAGEVVDGAGRPVGAGQPYAAHGKLYYYRAVPHEAPAAAPASVLFEDELLVVADKPHGQSVTPSGGQLHGTLLVVLRRQLGLPDLAPVHRIDRETAGLVLLTKAPQVRAMYQRLFAERAVRKDYQAIAPAAPQLRLPLTRATRLVPADHFMQMREAEPGDGREPNAQTVCTLLETRGRWARYGLRPLTGKRHQLRVHMAALGVPILGDRIYPVLRPHGSDDPADPLRLLAHRLAFTDPVTGRQRHFTSARELAFPAQALP